MRRLLLILSVSVLTMSSAAYAEQATVVRDSKLHAEPYSDAQVISKLKKDSAIDVNASGRKGGWYPATSNNAGVLEAGWVRISNIRMVSPGAASQRESTDVSIKGLENMAGGLGNTNKAATATAIKGLDEEDIKNSNADYKQLEVMDQYETDPEDAAEFARQEELSSEEVEYEEVGSKGGFFNFFRKDK